MNDEASTNDTISNVERLGNVLTLYFPQHGTPEFRRLPVPGHSTFRCEVNLFGMPVETREQFSSWSDAKEAAAQNAFILLSEFLRLIRGRQDDPVFGKIFAPLIKELETFRAVNNVDVAEEEKVAMGHGRVIGSNMRDETTKERMLGPILSPLVAGFTSGVGRIVALSADTARIGVVEPTTDKMDGSESLSNNERRSNVVNPISILYQHYQKRSSSIDCPKFEEFDRRGYYGCIGRYMGHEAVIKAVYRKRNDARYEAARILCSKVLGDLVVIVPIAPNCPDTEDILVKDYSMGRTQTLLNKSSENGVVQVSAAPMPIIIHDINAAKNNPGSTVTEEHLKGMPTGPWTEKLLNGKKYISAVLEYCQKMQVSPPIYRDMSVNQSLTNAYCVRVESFDGRSFMSYAHTRKQDAKEDCAARIFQHLLKKRFVDEDGQVVNHHIRPAFRSSVDCRPRMPQTIQKRMVPSSPVNTFGNDHLYERSFIRTTFPGPGNHTNSAQFDRMSGQPMPTHPPPPRMMVSSRVPPPLMMPLSARNLPDNQSHSYGYGIPPPPFHMMPPWFMPSPHDISNWDHRTGQAHNNCDSRRQHDGPDSTCQLERDLRDRQDRDKNIRDHRNRQDRDKEIRDPKKPR
jgi:hypothetical protein